jgi:hypothetical protein
MIKRVCLIFLGMSFLLLSDARGETAGDGPPSAELGFGNWSLEEDGLHGILEITWKWAGGSLAGFQFDLTGVEITKVSGGMAEEFDFTIAWLDDTALGFLSVLGPIPPIDQPRVLVLVEFILNGEDTLRLENVVCSDPDAMAIEVVHDDVIDPYASDCCGDLNGDGVVDGADLTILLGEWGEFGGNDLDGDGRIDGADLTILLGCWGPCD